MNKKLITREFLESIGMTRCENGQFYKGDFKVKYHKVWSKKKWGTNKYYWAFTYYSAELYAKQMELFRTGKWVDKNGNPRTYRPNGISQCLVHRGVWAWYNGETPHDPIRNLDVCHKHDEVDNNDINNLYVDDHIGNLAERKIKTGGNPKCQQKNN